MSSEAKKKTGKENSKEQPQPLKAPAATAELLMEEETDNGTIQISENVIAAVVRKYTLDVDGVVRFANSGIVGGIAGMIAKRNYESSMIVDLEDEKVNISVTLILRFGVRIPHVAQMVQDVIRDRVEELTGKHVTRVNVLVQDLEDHVQAEDHEQEEERPKAGSAE